MLMKVFKHGKGSGKAPINYLTNTRGREHSPPEVKRGDPQLCKEMIDGIERQWRYTSGVLSFAPEDAPTETELEKVMDEFEQVAAPEAEAYFLWVKHTHTETGRTELHFVSPREELTTGKSLNIAPPNWQAYFKDFVAANNFEHGWARPDDLLRRQVVRFPAEELERATTRELVNELVQQRILAGEIIDRVSLVDVVQDLGFKTPRQGKNYVTIEHPETGEKWRMKGAFYAEDWTYDQQVQRTLEREALQRERGSEQGRNRREPPRPKLAQEARGRLGERIRQRAEFHLRKYGSSPAPALRRDEQNLGHDLEDRAASKQVVGLDLLRLHWHRPSVWSHDLRPNELAQIRADRTRRGEGQHQDRDRNSETKQSQSRRLGGAVDQPEWGAVHRPAGRQEMDSRRLDHGQSQGRENWRVSAHDRLGKRAFEELTELGARVLRTVQGVSRGLQSTRTGTQLMVSKMRSLGSAEQNVAQAAERLGRRCSQLSSSIGKAWSVIEYKLEQKRQPKQLRGPRMTPSKGMER
jgi:hypothetical protein